MKKLLLIAVLSACALMANGNYTKCIGCHGINGEKSALGKSKIISEMNSTEIVDALVGYKNGTYGGPMKGVMKGQVANMTDEQMLKIAEYIGKKEDQ